MLNCETFRVLLLAGLCLSTWGAPLGSTSSLQARHCGRTEQGSRETTEHLAGHHNGKLCMTSQMQLHSSSRLPEWQEPGGTAEVLPSTTHKDGDAVAEAAEGQNRQAGLVHARAEAQEDSTVSMEESLSEEKNKSPSFATPSESIAALDHTLGPGNVNTIKEPVSLSSTFSSATDQINPQKYTVQKGKSSELPFGVSTDRPAQTQIEPGHSDDEGLRSLFHSDAEEDKRTFQPLNSSPAQEHEQWEVKRLKKNISAKLNLEQWRGDSTEPPFFIQSPWAIGRVVTSLTTPGSSDGQALGATGHGEGGAGESRFTASELLDKAAAPGLLQPDLTLSSTLAELGGTWTESIHLQGVEEASVLPLSQEVGPEATMSTEDLPLIFAPFDYATPPRSSALAFELSVAMAPVTGMLGEGELEQAVSVDTDHTPSDISLLGLSDWPSPWQMSGAENSDALMTSQMPISKHFSDADLEHSDRTEKLQSTDFIPTSVGTLLLLPSPTSATTRQIPDISTTHLSELKKSQLEELESEEDEDDEDEDVDESEEEEEEEEEEIEEDLSEAPAHTPTRPSYSLIPPPPIWGHQNQGLIRSWVELIREKAGYVSGMLAPVGIGIAGALLIVGALYGIRMIHRKRRNSFKHQRRKQTKEVMNGPDQAMLLADSSEDEF